MRATVLNRAVTGARSLLGLVFQLVLGAAVLGAQAGAASQLDAPMGGQESWEQRWEDGAGAAHLSGGWIVRRSDNICGLKEAHQLSKPATIDFDALLEETPEMRKLRDEKIDRKSSEGIQLVTKATDRIKRACETVRADVGYCSVWKKITHKDGREIADISEKVKAELN